MRVSRILHAGYVFESGGVQIAFDPIFENPFSQNCYAFPAVSFDTESIKALKFDAVFISHFHDDHCSFESLDLLDRETPLYVFCVFEELFDLLHELGFRNVTSLSLNQTVDLGPIRVTPWKALDEDVDSIFQIQAEEMNVLNVVDSWIDEETLCQLMKTSWDLVLWPFQTMRELEVIAPSQSESSPTKIPEEWIEQLRCLRPKVLVPSSCQFLQEPWSWYNHSFFPISYARFEQEVSGFLPETKVLRLNPSVSVELTKAGISKNPSLPWMTPVGDQDVDYFFDPKNPVPATAEIAQHFSPLSLSEAEEAFEFCKTGLIERYQSLEEPEDPIFHSPFIWKLSVFDHEGVPSVYLYEVCCNRMKLLSVGDLKETWSTEIALAKLYSAIHHGEALSSLYLRVNVQEADVVEDPLIRALYSGKFGAYQKAQLKAIQARCLKARP